MNTFGMQLVFYGLAAVVLISAMHAVMLRNVAHAAFSLLPCFLGIAGFYAALDAHFFFVVQVLIYAGAILVLFIFALMLTRDVADPNKRSRNGLVFWALAISIATAASTASVITRQSWRISTLTPPDAHDQTTLLGRALIGPYAVPFEAASLVLLAAMMGAVVLASGASQSQDTDETGDTSAEEVAPSKEVAA